MRGRSPRTEAKDFYSLWGVYYDPPIRCRVPNPIFIRCHPMPRKASGYFFSRTHYAHIYAHTLKFCCFYGDLLTPFCWYHIIDSKKGVSVMSDNKTVRFGFTLTESLKNDAERLAKARGLSLASYIRLLLTEAKNAELSD